MLADSFQVRMAIDTTAPTPPNSFTPFMFGKTTLSEYDESETERICIYVYKTTLTETLLLKTNFLFIFVGFVSQQIYTQYLTVQNPFVIDKNRRIRIPRTYGAFNFSPFSFFFLFFFFTAIHFYFFRSCVKLPFHSSNSFQKFLKASCRQICKTLGKVFPQNINASGTYEVKHLIPAAQLDITMHKNNSEDSSSVNFQDTLDSYNTGIDCVIFTA